MVKVGSLKRLKNTFSKPVNLFMKYGEFKKKYLPKMLKSSQRLLSNINENILKNDMIMNTVSNIVPGGNYINTGSKILSKAIDTNLLIDAGDLLENANDGIYKKDFNLLKNDLSKIKEKILPITTESKKFIKDLKQIKPKTDRDKMRDIFGKEIEI